MDVAVTDPRVRVAPSARIHGLDLARGLAMAAMLTVHYVWVGAETGPGAALARAMNGRAMPLFVMLGGVGVVLVSRRSANPDRGLVIRGVLLFGLGLALDSLDTWIAIVLQSYGLLFVASPLFRRIPTRALAGSAVAAMAIGGWTHQVVGQPRQLTSIDDLAAGWPGVRSLLFDGYYPFFPVFAFFAIGLLIGRLDLRRHEVAVRLAVVGSVVGLGGLWLAGDLADWFGVDPTGGKDSSVAGGSFEAARLLDASGHSAMPAWVISAAGTSAAVIGLSLLAARRWPALTRPVATLGTVALSFYVFQVLTTKIVPNPSTTSLAQEWLTVAVLYGGFLAAAVAWKQRFRSGPLEAVLRLGSGRRAG